MKAKSVGGSLRGLVYKMLTPMRIRRETGPNFKWNCNNEGEIGRIYQALEMILKNR